MPRSQLAIGLLLALGLTVRLVLAWSHPGDLLSDNDGYLAHARPVAAGVGFHGPWSNRPTAFRPPGYPIALGVLMAGGLSDSAAVASVSLVSCVVIILLTRTLARYCGLDQRWSLLAVLSVAVDPLLLRYSILPMTEVPCAAILLAAVVAFQKFLYDRDRNGRGLVRYGVYAGVLFGIGTLIRPVMLIVCAFLTVYAVGRQLRPQSSATASATLPTASASTGRCRNVMSAMIPSLVAGLVLFPWIMRNAVQFHRLIPATTHGGYTLALGNNPDFYRDVINGTDEFPWDGVALDAWQKRMIQQSESEGVPPGNEPAADDWYYSQATAAIRAEPVSFLKAVVLRLRRFWAISTADATNASSISMRLVMVWYVILWTGLALQIVPVLVGKNSRHHRPMTMLWLAILAFLVMHSVYWTDTRMRAPVMPIMIVISVAGWQTVSWQFLKPAAAN